MFQSFYRTGGTLGLALTLVGCVDQQSATQGNFEPTATTPYFADDGLSNAVAVVQHPAGVYANGKTYVTYQGPLEDPYVAVYDHETGMWEGPVKAGNSLMGKDPNRRKPYDNHGKPTMIIDDAGHIHIFFGGHGGMRDLHGENALGNHHYGENKHVVSVRPGDISEWEERDTITPFGTYNQVLKMDNGDLYLFYRHGAHRSDWVYQKSQDNGRTFDPPVPFLKHKRRRDLPAVDSWYAWVERGEDDDIIISFDYHLCWDSDARERGHTANREDLYFMIFDTKSGEFRNIDDKGLPIPLTREVAERDALVADTGDLWSFNGTADLDPSGHPHILINLGPDTGVPTGGPKAPTHFRWTGKNWSNASTIGPRSARGALDAVSDTDIHAYLGYRDETGQGIVSRWDSENGGETFEEAKIFLKRPDAGFAITSLINNPHPDARFIVAEKVDGSPNRRMYLIGDSGPVHRKAGLSRRSGD